MAVPEPLPPALSNRAFRAREAHTLGVTRARLRAQDLRHPHHGVQVAHDAETPRDRALAYAPLLLPGQFYSHTFAATLWGLPLPLPLENGPIHVSAAAPQRAPKGAGIVGHKLDGSHWETVELGRVPVSTVVDVWCQLGSLLSVGQLVVVGDALVRRQLPLATMQQLVRGLARMNGRRGAKRLRAAFSAIRPRTDSPQETRLRRLLVEAGLPEPEVNRAIFDETGTFLALGDLVYPDHQVLVEYDGAVHFATEGQAFRDIDRLDGLMAAGWRVIRVNRSHLATPSLIANRVAQALHSRGGPNG
ncbi:hypothetical protein KXS11_01605 [Plantibacter flavus]|uniref:hypothetical protein n=1 Tax=Plantibacter flavus TaxID=150123 RepID=UPI003F18F7F9